MASDTDSPRRKHHRSPSDEDTDKSSKRHKHRHHHRHHRRHRSKKEGDDCKVSDSEIAPSHSPIVMAAGPVADSNRAHEDDDVEEGEILEDEIHEAGRVGKAVELGGEEKADRRDPSEKENGFAANSVVSDDIYSDSKRSANGALDKVYLGREGKKKDREDDLKGSRKIISYHEIDTVDIDESKLSYLRKSSSSDSRSGRHKTTSHDEVRRRNRSVSREHAKGRSRSSSVTKEEEQLKRRRRHNKYDDEYDDEKVTERFMDIRREYRESSRDVERGSTGRFSRYHDGESKHYSADVLNRDGSREREMDKERKNGKERDRNRDRDARREKEQEGRRDRDGRRERERERSLDRDPDRDRHREIEWDSRRERERARSRDRVVDKERIRERSRDSEVGRERRREKARESRDRDEQSRRNRSIREKSYDRDASTACERDRDPDRDRYRERDRLRDRDRETERERRVLEVRRDMKREKVWDIKTGKEKAHSSSTGSLDDDRDKLKREEDEQEDFEERIAIKLAEQEEEDLDRIKEESRKRRQAILEKYKNQRLQQNQGECVKKADGQLKYAGQPPSEGNVVKVNLDVGHDGGDVHVVDPSFTVGKSPQQNGLEASVKVPGTRAAGLGEGTPKSERSSENKYYDDIFGESPAGIRKSVKGDGLPVTRSGLHDNWDDAEGYYSYRFGEVLDGRYEIAAAHGKGVFSTVVRAKDLKAGTGDPDEVAVKIIRNNETMHKAGQLEVQILNKLGGADPDDKRHCVRLLSSFKYRNHLCLVFESLHMNLREVLKKFGRNIGLKLTAVRAYAKQLFIALKHLKNCGVLHCDIKPDNMLVNEAKNVLKLCDFGNAMFAGKNEITPYLVSRFYRAPEIILGLPYDHPMDIWSIGCCLYELYTGKVLFPGPTNNDMLRLHMELKGPFPKKMLRKGAFVVDQHFDQDLNFLATEEDPVTRKIIKRMIVNIKPKDIGTIITGSTGEDPKMLSNFKDLLDKIFVLDPEKRMTVHQALAHPFITGK